MYPVASSQLIVSPSCRARQASGDISAFVRRILPADSARVKSRPNPTITVDGRHLLSYQTPPIHGVFTCKRIRQAPQCRTRPLLLYPPLGENGREVPLASVAPCQVRRFSLLWCWIFIITTYCFSNTSASGLETGSHIFRSVCCFFAGEGAESYALPFSRRGRFYRQSIGSCQLP